jgi:hypothetical protein
MNAAIIREFEELERQFRRKAAAMSAEELAEYDEWFSDAAPRLTRFYGIHAELLTDRQIQRFLDYLYMYAVVHNKTSYDERYDQPVFAKAVSYAKAEPTTVSGILAGEIYSAIHRLGPRLREEYRQARAIPMKAAEINSFLNGVLGGLVKLLEDYGFTADISEIMAAYRRAKGAES